MTWSIDQNDMSSGCIEKSLAEYLEQEGEKWLTHLVSSTNRENELSVDGTPNSAMDAREKKRNAQPSKERKINLESV